MLGHMEVVSGGKPIQGWRTTKTRALLAYLAIHLERPVTRDQILEALWPESDWEAAQAVFHSSLYAGR